MKAATQPDWSPQGSGQRRRTLTGDSRFFSELWPCPQLCREALALLGTRHLVGPLLSPVGCLAASLTSTYQMPDAPLPVIKAKRSVCRSDVSDSLRSHGL